MENLAVEYEHQSKRYMVNLSASSMEAMEERLASTVSAVARWRNIPADQQT